MSCSISAICPKFSFEILTIHFEMKDTVMSLNCSSHVAPWSTQRIIENQHLYTTQRFMAMDQLLQCWLIVAAMLGQRTWMKENRFIMRLWRVITANTLNWCCATSNFNANLHKVQRFYLKYWISVAFQAIQILFELWLTMVPKSTQSKWTERHHCNTQLKVVIL